MNFVAVICTPTAWFVASLGEPANPPCPPEGPDDGEEASESDAA